MIYNILLTVFAAASWIDDEPRFVAETIDDQVTIGYGLAIGDVDGDGKPDILMADKSQFVWYRNGDWKRFVMVDNLTEMDNVCIAARDIDGDGKVEIAVGAQWNPGERVDTARSGSVHYLIRPEDPTQPWTPVALYHEPTIHRMQWVQADDSTFHLVVLPLRGIIRDDGHAQTPNILVYEKPDDPTDEWAYTPIWQPMGDTHNLDVFPTDDGEMFYIAGDDGMMGFSYIGDTWTTHRVDWMARGRALSEVRMGHVATRNTQVFATIEPLHGDTLALYSPGLADSRLLHDNIWRIVLDRNLNEGHALGMADFMGIGRDQVVVGWRAPNKDGYFGVKLYVPFNQYWEAMDTYWLDRGDMACEDLQIADMDGDGKPDIIAAGRSTNNLKIYWNRNGE